MWQELEAVACGLVVKGGTSSISTFSPIHIAFLVTTTWPRKNLDVLGSELLFVASRRVQTTLTMTARFATVFILMALV